MQHQVPMRTMLMMKLAGHSGNVADGACLPSKSVNGEYSSSAALLSLSVPLTNHELI